MNEKEFLKHDHHYGEDAVEADNICVKENLVYKRPSVLTDVQFHYCPGCGHGVAHRIIAEVIEELGIQHALFY